MMPQGFNIRSVPKIDRYVTNYDRVDLADNYAYDMRGVRLSTGGLLAQRDFGTKLRHASYPTTNMTPSTVSIVDGFTLFDPNTATEYEIVIATTDSGNRLKAFVYDGAWIELTRFLVAKVNQPVAIANTTLVTDIDNITLNGVAYAPATDELVDYVAVKTGGAVNVAKRQAVIITANTATAISNGQSYLGADGLTWQDNDDVYLFKGIGLSDGAFATGETAGANGAPHVRFMDVEQQRKFTMFYADTSTTPITPYLPLRMMKRDSPRKYFWTGAAANLFTINSGANRNWFVESGGGLCVFRSRFGDPFNTNPALRVITPASGAQTTATDFPQDAWFQVKFTCVNGATPTPGTNPYQFFYITVLYGYQESDPVVQIFTGTSDRDSIGTNFEFHVNYAKMPKDVTGFRIYDWREGVSNADLTVLYNRITTVGPQEYLLAKTIPLQSYDAAVTWTAQPTDIDGLAAKGAFAYGSTSVREGSDNIYQTLNHAWVMSPAPALIKPTFVTRATRDQGSVIAASTDDRTLQLTLFDGTVTHQDDNFPNKSIDNQGFRLKVQLNGHGELLGLATYKNSIVAIKSSEVEVVDIQSGLQDVQPADAIAKRSIIQTPYGLFWAGSSAIYHLPQEGGGISVVNEDWQNLYDGTMPNTAATGPIITSANRTAIVAGWDPAYEEVWFQIQISVNGSTSEYIQYRYSPLRKMWSVRKLNLLGGGATQLPVKYFSKKSDKTFTIGYQKGLLSYPTRTGAFPYRDEVANNDTGGQGFETYVLLNLGVLYGLLKNSIPYSFVMDYAASSIDGVGTLQVEVFGNAETSAYDTKTLNASSLPYAVLLKPRGSTDSIRFKISITSAQVSNIKDFIVSTLEFGFAGTPRIGHK